MSCIRISMCYLQGTFRELMISNGEGFSWDLSVRRDLYDWEQREGFFR